MRWIRNAADRPTDVQRAHKEVALPNSALTVEGKYMTDQPANRSTTDRPMSDRRTDWIMVRLHFQ